jgi:hypothetical protein
MTTKNKKCFKCKKKPRVNGSYCKPCAAEYMRELYAREGSAYREYSTRYFKQYYEENKEAIIARTVEYLKEHPEYQQKYRERKKEEKQNETKTN